MCMGVEIFGGNMFVPLCKQYGNEIVSTPLHIYPTPHDVDCGRRAQGSAGAFTWRFEDGLCETLHPNFAELPFHAFR
jgi:hypothetical protein